MSVRVARVARVARGACARVIHVGSHHHHRGSSCSYGRPPLRRHDTNRDRNQQRSRLSLSLSRTGVYTPRGDPTARAPRGIASSSRFIAAAALVECRVAVLYPGSWKTTAHRATKGDIARRADGGALTAVR